MAKRLTPLTTAGSDTNRPTALATSASEIPTLIVGPPVFVLPESLGHPQAPQPPVGAGGGSPPVGAARPAARSDRRWWRLAVRARRAAPAPCGLEIGAGWRRRRAWRPPPFSHREAGASNVGGPSGRTCGSTLPRPRPRVPLWPCELAPVPRLVAVASLCLQWLCLGPNRGRTSACGEFPVTVR